MTVKFISLDLDSNNLEAELADVCSAIQLVDVDTHPRHPVEALFYVKPGLTFYTTKLYPITTKVLGGPATEDDGWVHTDSSNQYRILVNVDSALSQLIEKVDKALQSSIPYQRDIKPILVQNSRYGSTLRLRFKRDTTLKNSVEFVFESLDPELGFREPYLDLSSRSTMSLKEAAGLLNSKDMEAQLGFSLTMAYRLAHGEGFGFLCRLTLLRVSDIRQAKRSACTPATVGVPRPILSQLRRSVTYEEVDKVMDQQGVDEVDLNKTIHASPCCCCTAV